MEGSSLEKDTLTRQHDKIPDTWTSSENGDGEGGLLVEVDDLDEKKGIMDAFYSLQGGMDIQNHEIVTIHRIQCEELWTMYATTKEDIAPTCAIDIPDDLLDSSTNFAVDIRSRRHRKPFF